MYDHPEYFWLSKFEAKTLHGRMYSVTYTGMKQYRQVFEQVNQIGEEFYWVDTTWGEVTYGNGDRTKWNYHYFCATDEELFATHILNEGVQLEGYYEADVFTFPKCVDGSYNCYRLNQCYFETYDRDAVEAYLAGRLQSGQYTGLDMQFAYAAAYAAAKQDLFGDDTKEGRMGKMILKNLPEVGWDDVHYSYICDEHANFINVDVFEKE